MVKSFSKSKTKLPKDFLDPDSSDVNDIAIFVMDYSFISKTKHFTDRGLMLPLPYTEVLSFIKTRYYLLLPELQDTLIDILVSVDTELTNFINHRNLKNASKNKTPSKHSRNR